MIKFKFKADDGPVLIGLGITKENIDLLMQGKPIMIELDAMGLPMVRLGILYGENEQDILAQLQPHISEETVVRDEKPVSRKDMN